MESTPNQYNQITATVYIHNLYIEFNYVVDGRGYNIQVPKTDNNAHLKEGDVVELIIGLNPWC